MSYRELCMKLYKRHSKDVYKLTISQINSNTANKGFLEEELVCKDLNENNALRNLLGKDYDTCSRVSGLHKIDIKSNNNIITAQVKKYKKDQFQQLDRHWVNDIIKIVPDLHPIESILTDLCEYPLLSNGTHIDKTKSIKKLCTSIYPQETLDNVIDILNKHRLNVLNYAFYGTIKELEPEYLIGVEYKNDKRTKIIFIKIKDIITYLDTLQFKISNGKTVIKLGDDGIISLQRKGGDAGKKSSNQLQVKIVVSKLLKNVNHLEYIL